ncbi:hypothetical protein [Chryseobacterium sp. MEBOG07]|uniref:hypothetical protein n=1 Tax=Chryseobacterium sp. MEBOG07 TaxID=2879939 RepID=UPI001F471D17|nr:hypothetical protein [Chryseobacterium sp. MEBOG07]UKB78341.1 hypothetical protein LF886_17920 [Chryseobacterium sp. MEBOG07]
MKFIFKNIPNIIMKKIINFNDLITALQNHQKEIIICRNILCNYSIILPEGVILKGEKQENGELPLLSFQYSDGIGVSANNIITNLNIDAPANQKAIYNTIAKIDLGTFQLENLLVKGQVSIIARTGVEKVNIIINNVDIISADVRHYLEQPQKYGVNVLQGALTIYNLNASNNSLISVNVSKISIGRKNMPVSGSGIFIAGFGDKGGRTEVSKLHTNAVYSNGKIPFGIADYITAGVFVLNGVHAKEVITDGEIITYGVNDMVLDIWGSVDDWSSNAPVISYGPSGVGFVNFGSVKNFSVNAPLKTFGLGARGYNQYDGTVENISFESIETFGDGSVGIQISKKIGSLTVKGDVTTHGSLGNSLVKGENVELPAYALSIKNGGEADRISINGNIKTFGENVVSYIVEKGGIVGRLNVGGAITATGKNSKNESIA